MNWRSTTSVLLTLISLAVFGLGSTLWTAGCSGKLAGATDDAGNFVRTEKTRFDDTIGSLGRTQSAVRLAYRNPSFEDLTGAELVKVQPMSVRLLEGKCYTALRDNLAENSMPKSLLLQASGSACPIYMDYKLNMSQTATASMSHMKVDYSVLDDAYRSLNDVDKVNLDFRFDSVTNNTSSGAFTVKGTGGGQGVIHSQKLGNIRLLYDATISGSGTISAYSISGLETLSIIYADGVKIELKDEFSQTHNGNSSHLTMNGHAISEEEVSQYLKHLNLDGLALGGQQNLVGGLALWN